MKYIYESLGTLVAYKRIGDNYEKAIEFLKKGCEFKVFELMMQIIRDKKLLEDDYSKDVEFVDKLLNNLS